MPWPMGKAKQFIPHSLKYFNLKREWYEMEFRAPDCHMNLPYKQTIF